MCGTVFQCLALHGGDSAGEVHFLLRTVTHDHRFLQGHVVFLQGDIDRTPACFHRDALRYVAQAGKDQDHLTRRNLKAVGAVGTGEGTGGRPIQDDADTGDGLSLGIQHLSGNRPVLGPQAGGREQQENQKGENL